MLPRKHTSLDSVTEGTRFSDLMDFCIFNSYRKVRKKRRIYNTGCWKHNSLLLQNGNAPSKLALSCRQDLAFEDFLLLAELKGCSYACFDVYLSWTLTSNPGLLQDMG